MSNPDLALMSEQAREAVRRVAQLFPTAVISGRGREKVQQFVRLGELYYAGSHGMDIVGPAAEGAPHADLAFQPAAQYAPLMDGVYCQLCAGVAPIPGSSVEHNKFCVSVHFRNCAPEDYPAGECGLGVGVGVGVGSGGGGMPLVCGGGVLWRVGGGVWGVRHGAKKKSAAHAQAVARGRRASPAPTCHPPSAPPPPAVVAVVDGVAAVHPELRVTRGRKVLEVRPQVDWDKGTALAHLLEMLGLADPAAVFCLYIGDDRTDEDAFKGGGGGGGQAWGLGAAWGHPRARVCVCGCVWCVGDGKVGHRAAMQGAEGGAGAAAAAPARAALPACLPASEARAAPAAAAAAGFGRASGCCRADGRRLLRRSAPAAAVLAERRLGGGILVSTKAKPTAGLWTLRDPTGEPRVAGGAAAGRHGTHTRLRCAPAAPGTCVPVPVLPPAPWPGPPH